MDAVFILEQIKPHYLGLGMPDMIFQKNSSKQIAFYTDGQGGELPVIQTIAFISKWITYHVLSDPEPQSYTEPG